VIEKKVGTILREQWSVGLDNKCGTFIESLRKDEGTVVVPVLGDEGQAIGLIDKQATLLLASNPLHYSVYQNRSVRAMMLDKFLSFDENTTIDEVASTFLREGLSLSQGGFIITRDGNFIGVGACTDTLNYLVESNSQRALEMSELHEEVMDSVRYASRIQQGLLPTKNKLQVGLKDIDVIWEPRDIVGGDVYWRSQDVGKEHFTIGLIDCTGHGVPGAMMSMVVLSILNRIYSEDPEVQPGVALAHLGNLVRTALNQDSVDCNSNDGFDAGFCKVDIANRNVVFAGARTNCFVVPRDEGPILRVPGEKSALGYPGNVPYEPLEQYDIPLDGYSMFCMASDGIFDQPGGPRNIAFGPKRFIEMVDRNRTATPSALMQVLHKTAEEWRGTELRRDDLSALAFRL
jgi:serine phosphatase RsbU (regulator of sigma subunit)